MNIKFLTCFALLLGCAANADPMHEFESCMDALGNVEGLPPNFPAGEFCADLTEQTRAPLDLEQVRRNLESELADGRHAFESKE